MINTYVPTVNKVQKIRDNKSRLVATETTISLWTASQSHRGLNNVDKISRRLILYLVHNRVLYQDCGS